MAFLKRDCPHAWTLLICVTLSAANPCEVAQPRATLSEARDGTAQLEIEGQVFHADGKRPAAGVMMYVYQTGPDGTYGRDAHGGPLIRAWLRTDQQGRYRYSTIRPTPYPHDKIPAHIHVQFWGPGVPLQYSDDLYLDDDPLVPPQLRALSAKAGRFANVLLPQRQTGRTVIKQDFRLKAKGDRFEESILHGVKRCQ